MNEERADAASVLPVFMVDLGGKEIVQTETPGVLKVIEDHDGSHKDLRTSRISVQSGVSLEVHGESSAGLAKKSFRLELVDEERNDRDLPLLGLPAGDDWVLHGCGADRTCAQRARLRAGRGARA